MGKRKSGAAKKGVGAEEVVKDLLGFLNFSDGTPNARFQHALALVTEGLGLPCPPEKLRDQLLEDLSKVQASDPAAFRNVTQAVSVVHLVVEDVLPAYREHHRDLLFHLTEEEFWQPFFMARVFEAVLSAGSPWDDKERIIARSLDRLNNYVGYRPIPVLENGQQSELYPHERFCPVPLWLKDAGAAPGRFQELIDATLSFLRDLPPEILQPSFFDSANLEELSLDVRAHDHLHPVNKRTNYMFGEWDPHQINTKGFYSRFIIRSTILEALVQWYENADDLPKKERLYDVSAVLSGTILMASSVSGSGPDSFSSDVTLSSLLPRIARQRDAFYDRLLKTATGTRAKRLKQAADRSRQPFGHVRHELNMFLAQYGARQVQHRHLSWFFASLGYEQASREEASQLPCLAARFESEIQCRVVTVRQELQQGNVGKSVELLTEAIELLHRGIDCGGIVDPWSILAFQGQFPLFTSREDAIPDGRIEVLIELMEQLFAALSSTLAESAVVGDGTSREQTSEMFRRLAEQWDRYATTVVADLPRVHGGETFKAADHVASVLADWRTAGETAGDISFWRERISDFDSPRSFAQVVSALLDRNDTLAATGLIMQWLSLSDDIALEAGPHSIYPMLMRLLSIICKQDDKRERWQSIRRLFAFLEANAGEFREVPQLQEYADRLEREARNTSLSNELDPDQLFDGPDDDDEESDLFGAAYEGVVFRDSADDGQSSDTMDEGFRPGTTEFEILFRQLDPRLRFLHMLSQLYRSAATALPDITQSAVEVEDQVNPDTAAKDLSAEIRDQIAEWLNDIRRIQKGLIGLLQDLQDFPIEVSSGNDLDANIEFDVQTQARFMLMHAVVNATVEYLVAERLLECQLSESETRQSDSKRGRLDRAIRNAFRALQRRDVESLRDQFPALIALLSKHQLLYVPFESDGNPRDVLRARTLQSTLRVLLTELPRLGLLSETYQLLQVAFRMERSSRLQGKAVTEFDGLFRVGLTAVVETFAQTVAATGGKPKRTRSRDFSQLDRMLSVFQDLWLQHSRSMRLGTIEDLQDEERAEELKAFIEAYGEELFHTRMLTLGNIRAILHHGVELFFEELIENGDPLVSSRLADDLEMQRIDAEAAADMTEFVYECVVENFDRFLEYNTTTTHSDYGDRIFCLLEFLRVETDYDRQAWNAAPFLIAHEALIRADEHDVADDLEEELRDATRELAEGYVEELDELEETYGVRLPTLRDRIHECIVGPMAVNRMTALVGQCLPEIESDETKRISAFDRLRQEIEVRLQSTLGSGIDPPPWMQELARELDRLRGDVVASEGHITARIPLTRKSLEAQVETLETLVSE